MTIIHEKQHFIDIDSEIEPIHGCRRAAVWIGLIAFCVVCWAVVYSVVLIAARAL